MSTEPVNKILNNNSLMIGMDHLKNYSDWFLHDKDLATYFLLISNLDTYDDYNDPNDDLRECVLAITMSELYQVERLKYYGFSSNLRDPDNSIVTEMPSIDDMRDYATYLWLCKAFEGYMSYRYNIRFTSKDCHEMIGVDWLFEYRHGAIRDTMNVYKTRDSRYHFRYENKFADESFTDDPNVVFDELYFDAIHLIDSYRESTDLQGVTNVSR